MTVEVTLPPAGTDFVLFGNEWVGINVGNEVTSVGGADMVEFANDADASPGRRMTERSLYEYCMVFDLLRGVIVNIWKQTTDRSLLKAKEIWDGQTDSPCGPGNRLMYFYCGA